MTEPNYTDIAQTPIGHNRSPLADLEERAEALLESYRDATENALPILGIDTAGKIADLAAMFSALLVDLKTAKDEQLAPIKKQALTLTGEHDKLADPASAAKAELSTHLARYMRGSAQAQIRSTTNTVVTARSHVTVKVADRNAIPTALLLKHLDDAAIEKAMRAAVKAGATVIAGVSITPETRVTIR